MVRKNRLVWIANVRGLMIAFVVMFHACQQYAGGGYLTVFLRLLILPLFLFLSGMMIRNNVTFTEFVKQKFTHVLKPYFQFSAFTFGIYLIHKIFNHEYMREYNPLNLILGIFYASNCPTFPLLNLPLWFLPCLFVSQCLIFYFLRFSKPVFYASMVLLAILGTFLGTLHIPLPWSLPYALSLTLFGGLGYYLAPKLCRSSHAIHPAKVALFWAVWAAGAFIVEGISAKAGFRPLINYVASADPVLGVVSYIASSAAIFGFIGLFQRIPKISYLSTIGKHSIEVLAIHPIAFMVVTTLLRRLFHIPVERASQDLTGILNPVQLYGVIFAYFIAGFVVPLTYVKCLSYVTTRKTLIKNRLKETQIFKAAYSLKRMASF